MTDPNPSFLTRVTLAIRAFLGVLRSPELARRLVELGETPGKASPRAPEGESGGALRQANPDSARLIDFLEEDVAQYSDAEIGAAVRVVHEGCRKVLREHFTIAPVFDQAEGARITLEPGFDAAAIRPTGNLVGEPPFTGTLAHRGWRATGSALPKLTPGHDTSVLAPAEVEL